MLVNQYSKALFELSNDKIFVIKENFTIFLDLLDEDFRSFLVTPTISKNKKKEVIKNSLKGFEELFIYFLYVVIDNGRMGEIENIYSDFNNQIEESNGLKVIDVYTIKPLTESEEVNIVQMLAPRFSGRLKIHNILDDSLLGGMRIECNGETIDQTFKAQMHNMKSFL